MVTLYRLGPPYWIIITRLSEEFPGLWVEPDCLLEEVPRVLRAPHLLDLVLGAILIWRPRKVGGSGYPKSRRKQQNQLIPVRDKGGSKNLNILLTSYKNGPLAAAIQREALVTWTCSIRRKVRPITSFHFWKKNRTGVFRPLIKALSDIVTTSVRLIASCNYLPISDLCLQWQSDIKCMYSRTRKLSSHLTHKKSTFYADLLSNQPKFSIKGHTGTLPWLLFIWFNLILYPAT